MTLLPPNESAELKLLDSAAGDRLASLWRDPYSLPRLCNARYLPALARIFEAEIAGLNEEAARDALAEAFYQHKHDAAVSQLESAIAAINQDELLGGLAIAFEEWFSYGGDPYCFRVFVEGGDKAIAKELYAPLTNRIERAKRLTTRFDLLIVNRAVKDESLFLGGFNHITETIVIGG
ncbi:MAG: phage tail protein [Helicobacteraceae bacterium]|jgi:P2-related tail formation protein|nr:phage tail protein [Helicobacteraceae bacterium]